MITMIPKLVQSPKVYSLLNSSISSAAILSVSTIGYNIISPKKIYDGLQEHVIGQTDVKMSLSVSVHNHLLRSALNLSGKKKQEVENQNEVLIVNRDNME